jgi:predicted nucleotidyltransferase
MAFSRRIQVQFNVWSDVDVLVVAERLPARLRDRLELFGRAEPGLEVVAWTPHEWRQALERGNRIAREACEQGVWLVGSADEASR